MRHIAGDASDRAFARLVRGGETAVLMETPAGSPDDPLAFERIARHLSSIGLSAPRVLARDATGGLMLLEDLGRDLYPAVIARAPSSEATLYAAATDVLAELQARPAPPGLPDLAPGDWAAAAGQTLDWYARAATGRPLAGDASGDVAGEVARLIARHGDGPRVAILRDYHAGNLLWLPGRAGLGRVGLLDFQLAQMGQPVYDLVSLLQDARRDVGRGATGAAQARFASARGAASFEDAFGAAYAVWGAQRALRILGVFARLCLQAGKAHYVGLMPRVWDHLRRNLEHPACAALAGLCRTHLAAPGPDVRARIEAQCGTHPRG